MYATHVAAGRALARPVGALIAARLVPFLALSIPDLFLACLMFLGEFRTLATMHSTLRFALFAGVTGVLHPFMARAEGPDLDVAIEWYQTDGCSSREEGLRQIETLLGRSLRGPNEPAERRVTVTYSRSPGGRLHAEILRRRGDSVGRRALEHEHCDELTRAVSLIVALSIDARVMAEVSDKLLQVDAPTTKSGDGVEPNQASLNDQKVASEPERRKPVFRVAPAGRGNAPLPLMARARLGYDVGFGRQPALDYGPGAGFGLALGALEIHAEGQYWQLRRVTLRRGQAHLRSWELGLAVCGVVRRRANRWQIPLCGLARAGQQLGTTQGTDVDGEERVPRVALGVRTGLTWKPPRGHPAVAFSWLLTLTSQLTRASFSVAGHGSVHRQAVLAGHSGLALDFFLGEH